jgi:hypothetical protein
MLHTTTCTNLLVSPMVSPDKEQVVGACHLTNKDHSASRMPPSAHSEVNRQPNEETLASLHTRPKHFRSAKKDEKKQEGQSKPAWDCRLNHRLPRCISRKDKYRPVIDSAQVDCSKGEKNFAKRVKST